jgi:hypothetical protein
MTRARCCARAAQVVLTPPPPPAPAVGGPWARVTAVAAMPPSALRTSYAPGAALTPFFSGGAARLSPDGRTLAAPCGDDAQLVDANGGTVLATLTGDTEPITALAFRCGCGAERVARQAKRTHAALRRLWPPGLRLRRLKLPADARCVCSALRVAQPRRERRVHRQPQPAVPAVGGWRRRAVVHAHVEGALAARQRHRRRRLRRAAGAWRACVRPACGPCCAPAPLRTPPVALPTAGGCCGPGGFQGLGLLAG